MPVSILRWHFRMRRVTSPLPPAARAPADGVEMVGVRSCVKHAVEIADAERAEDEDRNAHARASQDDAFLDVGAREHRRTGLLEREGRLPPRRDRRRWL